MKYSFAASQRQCGFTFRFWSLVSSWMTSRPNIFHERGNLREIDAGGNTVETSYPLDQLIGEELFGCLL